MIPERARAVVIGGGVIGCSVLYHLARQGWTDSVLVEQYQLTHGSTWHSAGLVGQLRSSLSLTRMMQYSVGLYAELKELTGNDPGWHQLGGLRLASSEARHEELRRQASWAKTFGLPMEIVSAREAQELFPPMSTEGVVAAAFIPDDGYLDPSQLTFSLAEGARRLGAALHMRTTVTGIETDRNRVVAVETGEGRIECEVVVNAAGMYAPQVARLVGVEVPIIPYGHQYLVTEPFEPALEPLPTLRDPDNLVYFRTEVGGLVMGGYERTPAPWALDGIPPGFEAQLLPEEWDRMEELFANAIGRVPALEDAEVKKFFNGPEAFTPDADFLLGETDVVGFWVAAGGCAHGLAGAGGVGKVMGEWIVDGRPEWDVWPLDLRRFGRQYASRSYTLARSYESLSKYYDIKYPGEEKLAGRPLRMSPVYPRHRELGAVFGEKGGWERVNWYESNAAGGDESLRPRGWAGENWSPAIEVEARAARESVALFDQSSFSKIEVRGAGALAFLEHMCANRIDRPVGTVVYTQLLNARGGIEADLSVMRRAEDWFLLVTGTAFGTHDRAWLQRHAPEDVLIDDVTSSYACLCL
ncbi:MAG TPA: FAD-dependent oxidoreductase, partial [Gaiellaceae bacterium]|nr:FAD-dependent oxidoreductase [Gaiellaceae bacterium]